jgi:hypothetical protein
LDSRIARSIPETVLCLAWNFDKIPGTGRDPMRLASFFGKHLKVSREHEEGLDPGMAMQWYTNARRNRSFHNTGSFIARLRSNQKLDTWPKHLKSLAVAFHNSISKCFGFGKSFHLPLSFALLEGANIH